VTICKPPPWDERAILRFAVFFLGANFAALSAGVLLFDHRLCGWAGFAPPLDGAPPAADEPVTTVLLRRLTVKLSLVPIFLEVGSTVTN
jgi:hypothetical protein